MFPSLTPNQSSLKSGHSQSRNLSQGVSNRGARSFMALQSGIDEQDRQRIDRMYQVFEKKVFHQALPKVVKTPRKSPSSRTLNKTPVRGAQARIDQRKESYFPATQKSVTKQENGNRPPKELITSIVALEEEGIERKATDGKYIHRLTEEISQQLVSLGRVSQRLKHLKEEEGNKKTRSEATTPVRKIEAQDMRRQNLTPNVRSVVMPVRHKIRRIENSNTFKGGNHASLLKAKGLHSFSVAREDKEARDDLKKRFKALMSYDFQEGLRKMSEALKKKEKKRGLQEKSVTFLLPDQV